MDSFDMTDKKKEIIETTWEYLMEKGLSNASIGDLCKEKKISQSSLYYWFKDKDDIWISAGKYGAKVVAIAILEYTTACMNDMEKYFQTLLDDVDKYRKDLRMVTQITTSPIYGNHMRQAMFSFNPLYEKYCVSIIEKFGCSSLDAQVFVYTIIAIIVDYVIWEDREKSQMLLDDLRNRVMAVINPEK